MKTLRNGVRARGGVGHSETVGENSRVRAGAEASRWGSDQRFRAVAAAEGSPLEQSGGAADWGLGGRGRRDHRRALSGEGGKCGPAPPPVRGEDPGAHGLPSLPSRFRHPELLFPLQPGRLQPLSTG